MKATFLRDGRIEEWTVHLRDAIDETVVALFTGGHCAALALALHDRTGYPLVAVAPASETPDPHNGGICHVAVQPPDAGPHEIVDILGRRVIGETEWADYDRQLMWTQADLTPITREAVEALQDLFAAELRLPTAVAAHYARLVVRTRT